MKPKLVFFNDAQLLESPCFDSKNQLLYFVSIHEKLIHCINIKTMEIESFLTESPVSYVQILDYKKLIYAEKNGIFHLDLQNRVKKFITQLEKDVNYRYNDGKLDAKGRLLIGTMGYPDIIDNGGKVYSWFENKSQVIIENTTISNGICFSKDNKKLFFIDTPTRKVKEFSYNIQNGEVKYLRDLIEFNGIGIPDGMCIDKNENLWIAEWSGGCVSQFDSLNGRKIRSINLPCINVTSCCLDNEENLYVTTAKNETIYENLGGGLFYINLKETKL